MKYCNRESPHATSTMGFITLIASVALLVAVSIEIIHGNNTFFSSGYLTTQFIICIVFLIDGIVRLTRDNCSTKSAIVAILFLVMSIPYLNIIHWSGVDLSRSTMMGIGAIPIIRSFFAVFVITNWLAYQKYHNFLLVYTFSVVVFTYLASLVFYDFEIHTNHSLTSFGNALWWAGMSLSTVGAQIFPVTAVGKVLAVMLPLLGMMMLPVFTSYILTLYYNSPSNDRKRLFAKRAQRSKRTRAKRNASIDNAPSNPPSASTIGGGKKERNSIS